MKEKKKFFSVEKILLTFALAFLMTLAFGQQAKAAAQVTGVKQTDDGSGWVDVKWNAVMGDKVSYVVELSDNKTSFSNPTTKTVYSPNATFIGLSSGKSYYARVKAVVGGVPGAYSSIVEVVTSPGSTTSKISHTKSTETSISVSWKSVPGANQYVVRWGKSVFSGGQYQEKTVTGTKTDLKKLGRNGKYSVAVFAVRKASTGYKAIYSSGEAEYGLPVLPTKATGLSCRYYWQSLKEVSMECNERAAADGYQWQLYTSYSGKDKCIKTVNSNNRYADIKNSALGKHNFYKVRVRAYALNSSNKKMYGAWSGWKYICPQPDVKMKSASSGLKVSWDKIKGADQYTVYVSTKQNSGYKKYCSTRKTSTTVKKCGSSKLKSGKRYYVYVVAKNKVGRTYYSGIAEKGLYCWSLTYRK